MKRTCRTCGLRGRPKLPSRSSQERPTSPMGDSRAWVEWDQSRFNMIPAAAESDPEDMEEGLDQTTGAQIQEASDLVQRVLDVAASESLEPYRGDCEDQITLHAGASPSLRQHVSAEPGREPESGLAEAARDIISLLGAKLTQLLSYVHETRRGVRAITDPPGKGRYKDTDYQPLVFQV